MIHDPEALLQILSEGNPWWTAGKVPETLVPPYRMSLFPALREAATQRPILALAGPRQVGKTTLMYQLIADALSSGVDPHRLLFVSFDAPGLNLVSDDPLNDSVHLFGDRILGTPWRESSPIAVFLDEVTKAPNWHRDLKGWFDLRYPVNWIVSDSSPVALRQGSAQSLTGRVSTYLVVPWGFRDLLAHRRAEPRWGEAGDRCREALRRSVLAGKSRPLLDALRTLSTRTAARRATLRSALDRYLLVDGFPELLATDDLAWCARRLREYLSLTMVRDLYRLFNVRSPIAMESLLGLAAKESGQRISYRGWAETLRIREETLLDYLAYLEDALLVSRAEFFSGSRAVRSRKQRKIYVPNPGLRNVLLGRLHAGLLQDPLTLGPTAESIVHDHARRLAAGSPGELGKAFYWRDRRGREVDVVIELEGRPLPIEVKFRGDPTRDVEGIRAFLQSHGVPFGLVVSRDLLKAEGDLLYVPLDLFLLTV